MRRATENQGNTRTLSEYFSPRSKGKDFALQERSLHHFMSFAQETPMKPSQVPNQLPHPPPRRMLPLQSPEVCHRDRLGPPRHPPHHLGPVHSPGFLPRRPANIISSGSSPNRPNHVPQVRLVHSAQPAGSFCPRPAPVSPTNGGTTAKQSQPVSPGIVCPATSHTRRDHVTEPKVTPSCTGTKTVTAQKQESTKDQRRKSTPSEKLISVPTVNLDHTSQKRHMDFEECQGRAKKLCVDGANSGKAQTPKPTVSNSHSASLVSQPSPQQSSASEPKPTKAADGHQSAYLELSTSKPTLSLCASLNSCVKGRPSMGAKQAFVRVVKLDSIPNQEEQSCRRTSMENDKREKSSAAPQKDNGNSPDFQFSNHHSGLTHRSPSVLPVRTPSRGNHVQESRKSDSSTHKSPVSCHTAERNKGGRPRRPAVIPDDIAELFTPDPVTLVNPGHKTTKPKPDTGPIKSTETSEKSCCSSTTVSGSCTAVTASSCRKTHGHNVAAASFNAADASVSSVSPACHKQFLQPTVALERVKLENLRHFSPKDSGLNKHSPSTSSGRQNKDETVKSNDKRASLPHNTVRPCAVEKDATSEQTPSSHRSIVLERPPSERRRKQANEDVSIDDDLDLDLDLSLPPLDMDRTQSSHSSEEDEPLLSLQEMMERAALPPDSQERGTFSAPSTPGSHSCHSKPLLPTTTKSGVYRNNLDQMLKEINNNKKAKEMETQLLNTCKENLMRIGEYEEAAEEGNQEEGISAEHQEFLQRYSLMSSAIKEVPPGEVVFNLEKFGRIFNHDTLQLRQCRVKPNGMAQKTLLWSSPAHLRWHVTNGLFQEAYNFRSPCPAKVTRFLFKMMSVHEERLVSERILKILCDIAISAGHQIVKNGGQHFEVWVPSLADVVLVLMNMGAAFVTLFPSENLQPPFTEGNLLDDIVLNESTSDKGEQRSFPEHNCSNIFKYLSYCMCLCPRAYSDDELLLLLTVVGRVCLDTRLIVQPSLDLYPLLFKLINNFRDWDTMLPKICLAVTDMTDDHHNMCLLVQLLPDNTRGKQLRRHLSLSMISKLLDGRCTYRPTEKEIQLSDLRPYLPRIKPSTLVRSLVSSSCGSHKDKDMTSLDQQAYYLCYSLLTLTNEASNFQFFSANQKEQLLFLCSEMETHIKCDIRESEKCLYRSKVKDLVARIYTKWQMLLQRTRPLHGKLYDYWQPCLPIDLTSGQVELKMDNTDEGEVSVTKDGGGESSTTEEKEVATITEDQEDGDIRMDDGVETAVGGDYAMDDREETAEAIEVIQGELSREAVEMKMEMDGWYGCG